MKVFKVTILALCAVMFAAFQPIQASTNSSNAFHQAQIETQNEVLATQATSAALESEIDLCEEVWFQVYIATYNAVFDGLHHTAADARASAEAACAYAACSGQSHLGG